MSRVQELEKLIIHHKALYYQGRPAISDDEYDSLEEELSKLNPKSSILNLVGADVSKNTKKIKHKTKMLSLNKTYKLDELMRWKGDEDIVSTFKIDGVSCSIIYKEGSFKLGKTRGDGSFGEDITEKLKWINSIPSLVNIKGENTEVRGELYCLEKDFFDLSDEMVGIGLEKPTSQRNIVAGLISRKENPELCRYISFKAFDLLSDNLDLKTEIKKYELLKQNKFIIPEVMLHKNEKSVQAVIDDAAEFMSEGDYQIDGLVFSYNDLSLHDKLGATAHHPRYRMAFKFKGASKTTKINEIVWSISRNGILTPVADVEPVELSGAMISRVTLHNYGMVRQFNLKKNDEIEIIRSGEVIPKFLSVLKSSKENFEVPEFCPVCKSEVAISDIRLLCLNDECPGKNKEVILNFIKKIGIDDLSSKRLDELINHKLVKSIPDLYRIKKEELLNLDKVQEKLAQKIISNIDASKQVDLITFLSALGIQGGAYNKCEKIFRNGFNTIEKLRKMSVEDLIQVESFAEKSATEFMNSLQSKFDLIDELLEVGFQFEEPQFANDSKIVGKSFCITGALSEKRTVVEDRIRKLGGVVVSSVSKNTNYLVTNEKESKSSKFKKAESLNIPILSEVDLNKLLVE